MSTHKGIFIRGPANPNGTAQWIRVGTLVNENNKEYILMDTLALNPSVVTLAADKGTRLLANLYDVEPPKKNEQQKPGQRIPTNHPKKVFPPIDSFDDDIPF